MNFSIESLFPSKNNKCVPSKKGHRLDIESLFCNTPLNDEPDISFSSDILLDKIKKRRKLKLKYFYNMLRYCYERINSADDDHITDIYFRVLESIPECKSYTSLECLEFISEKLRMQLFDTIIINNTTMFISWKYLELKKEELKKLEKEKTD